MSKVLMIQGTGSDVGKSLLVAAVARAFSNRGLRVAPFKPQNMSNNAAVTRDGGEIGRAQALQARAARIDACADMNPVLLKPQGAAGSQLIVQGKVVGQAKAREFQQWKSRLMPCVLESFSRVAEGCDIVIVEGAGSAAEVNLRENDIANMGFARRVNAPVILLADIDRGGVIAQLVGCKAVLQDEDAALIEGFIVNKFRGDSSLFENGMQFITERTGWRALGLVPYFERAGRLPAEDAFGLTSRSSNSDGKIVIAVPLLPNIANFDDLDPLRAERDVRLQFISPGEPIPGEARLIILPGSKAAIADLAALRSAGWHIDIAAHLRRGGRILGICGGYQMMGRSIADPGGVEGPAGDVEALGLLDVVTELGATKTLKETSGVSLENGVPFRGYEMHVGVTHGPDCARPLLRFDDGRHDGAMSPDGLARGVYVHGLFADDRQRAALLRSLGGAPSALHYEHSIEETLDELAEHCARHIDLDLLLSLAR